MRVGETTFGACMLVRPSSPPSHCTLNAVLGGVWGSGFKPSWYMTGSDTERDPQLLVRVAILVQCICSPGSRQFFVRARMDPNSTPRI